MKKKKRQFKTCLGSLNESDHSWGFPHYVCEWCEMSHSGLLEERVVRALEEALKKIK